MPSPKPSDRSRRRDRLPTPIQIGQDLDRIVDAVRGSGTSQPLIEEYRWVYSASLQRSVGEGVKVRAISDPTGNVAAGKERMRQEVAAVAEKIGHAVNSLLSARDRLDRALKMLTPDRWEPERRYPRTVKDSELAESREAQERRMERREGFGEG